MILTQEDKEELRALMEVNDAIKGPSFLMRSHWRGRYRKLVCGGLVLWGDPPEGFDRKKFAGTTITAKGREAIGCPATG